MLFNPKGAEAQFRKSAVKEAWERAAEGPTGGKLCPICGEELTGESWTSEVDVYRSGGH
jgi:hypothetical protein